jgi:hypothetical protein
LEDIKNSFAWGVKINKMDIATLVVAGYQFLGYRLEREKKHKHPYFIRMFEAIAAGIFVLKCLKY